MQTFKNKKVLIFGLGLNDGGLGMAEFFLDQGAKVTITDGKTEEELKSTLEKLSQYSDQITYHLGGHIREDFEQNDIIVRNPAIREDNEWLEIAREAGKPIYMEMALFHQLCPCPIIGITGTRGKSTTTSLIYEFLKEKYEERVFLGGNIGKSAIRELKNLTEENIVVLEISSFQLDGMGEAQVSSDVAVVTNMYPDHLNWHADMEDYINDKKNIFRYQDENGVLVVNMDNEITKDFPNEAKSKVIRFSMEDSSANYYMENMKVYENGNEIFEISDLKLQGEHNLYNILGAVAVAKMYDVSNEEILNVLKNFNGVPGRQELVKELEGVRYYNDTTATSVEAINAMFDSFGEKNIGKIVMIAGGVDKGLDYSKLIPNMKKYLKSLILFDGTASEKIAELIGDDIPVEKYFGNICEAVNKAQELSEPGDMVILCPGAASFNMFANEFDRGDKYVNCVNELK